MTRQRSSLRQPRHPESPGSIIGTQVEQIMDEFSLSQVEKEFAQQVIVDFTRSVSMRIKEMRIKENLPRNIETPN